MAFAALVSVQQILQQLLHSDNPYPYDDCLKSEIETFHLKIRSLQSSLENIYPIRSSIRDEVNKLESDIRETVYGAQDWIEEFISSQTYRSVFVQRLKENAGKLDKFVATANSSAIEFFDPVMAFAAAVSVEQILQQYVPSDDLFPCDDCPKSEIESFSVKIRSLQSSLQNYRRSIRNKVESKIKNTVDKAPDLIEAFISSQTSQSAFLQRLNENAGKLDKFLTTPNSSAIESFDPAMAFAAVVSFEQILQQLLHSDDDCPKSEIESFHVKIRSLQSSCEVYIGIIRDKLGHKIRDTPYKAQGLIEAFISSQTAQSDFLQNLKEYVGKLDPILAIANDIADSMKEEQQTSGPSSANAETSKSSRASKSSKIVGQTEDLNKLRDEILRNTRDRQVISITGLPGIGKTTLARSLFEDKEVGDRFTIRSWVTVGQEYNAGEIFSKLSASIQSDGSDSIKVNHGNAEHLANQLYKSLLDNRYLIVVDDVWDIVVWDRIKNYFPDNKNRSRIVVTSRDSNIAGKVKSDFTHMMEPLDGDASWELLREKVFGGGHCPKVLQDTGKSIANHCAGLPLSITVVGGQLSQEMENVMYWKIVEEDIKAASGLGKEAYIEILSRSYEHLPSKLKGCFLYMGAFPEDSEIPVSKLVKLWVAEGFLVQAEKSSLEDSAEQYLTDLVDRNLIIPLKFSSNGKVKTCGMHDSIRQLAEAMSDKERFFVSAKKFPSQRNQSATSYLNGKSTQRRISVHKNILMCMKDVYESAKSIRPARTILYAGHYHHHPLPFCLTYHWLRVLDALTVHLIEFPNGLVKLIHLRYLALTFNGRLPASLSQLKNLLVLIVRRHPNIIIMGKSILPVEIWYMKQLRHILLTECDFPDLPGIQAGNSPLLENLQSLSSINAARCTEEFFKNMPNLKKLGIWIEAPAGPVNIYPDLLPHLEAFKFTVLSPIPGKEIELQRGLVFPEKLKKLSLSGCGLPWDRMATIEKFPFLEVLKLRQFAFRGPKWIPEKKQFPALKLLLIECLDLEELSLDFYCCENLESLIIRNCYELMKIDKKLRRIGTLKQVELVGCNYAAVNCVEKMRKKMKENGKDLPLRVYSSWGEHYSSPEDC